MGIRTSSDVCEFVAELNTVDPDLLCDSEFEEDPPYDPRIRWAPIVGAGIGQAGKKRRLWPTLVGRIKGGSLYVCCVINSSEFEHVGEYEWTAFAANQEQIDSMREIFRADEIKDNEARMLAESYGESLLSQLDSLPVVSGVDALHEFLSDLGETVAIEEVASVSQTL